MARQDKTQNYTVICHGQIHLQMKSHHQQVKTLQCLQLYGLSY